MKEERGGVFFDAFLFFFDQQEKGLSCQKMKKRNMTLKKEDKRRREGKECQRTQVKTGHQYHKIFGEKEKQDKEKNRKMKTNDPTNKSSPQNSQTPTPTLPSFCFVVQNKKTKETVFLLLFLPNHGQQGEHTQPLPPLSLGP